MLFQLIIIQVITFLAIVVVLRKFLYSETTKEAQRLRRLKEENLQKQRELQQNIETAEHIYQQKVAQAEEDIRKLRSKTEEEIEQLKQREIDKTREEAERIVKAAFNARDKIREEIALEMKKKVPELASQIFKEVLSSRVQGIIHQELAEEVINKVRAIEKSRFNVKIKEGEIILAYPLEKNKMDELSSLIAERLGYEVPLSFKEERRLVAGIIIKLGTLEIDGSLDNCLRHLEQS